MLYMKWSPKCLYMYDMFTRAQEVALQVFLFSSVFGEGEVIGTGEHHMLSEDYFKKRRRIFESQRPVFAQQSPPPSIENRYYMLVVS